MKKELVAYNEPKSPITENFKALRTNLQFMNTSGNIKTILVTSTLPGEGKSWTVANLAITFAQAGSRVIIIDADMRKGRQFSLFDVSPRPGLSNYLSGFVTNKNNIDSNDVRNFIKETEIENLYVMPTGDIPPNPSELLITEKMINLIEELKYLCDVVIIDTPPAALVTDAKILSRLADISLIVASHKETKMDNLKKVKKEIENVGGKVGGVILNKMQIQSKKYEGGYYYGETSLVASRNKGQDIFIKGKKTILEDRTENYKIKKEIKEQTNSNNIKNQNSNISRKVEDNNKNNNTTNEITKKIQEPSITLDKTQDILKQINNYLDEEKRKMNSGDKND